jgi:uncharacterized protein YkwD
METRKSVFVLGMLTALTSIVGHATIANRDVVDRLQNLPEMIREDLDPTCAICRSDQDALSVEGISLDQEEREFLRLLNDYRARNGLEPLQISIKLTRAAEWMAEDMARNKHMDPEHKDSLGRAWYVRTVTFGYNSGRQAENLLAGASSAADALRIWQNSPGHNENLLHPKMKVIGIARAKNRTDPAWRDYPHFWATDFGGEVLWGDSLK